MRTLPTDLDSPRAKLVYLYLRGSEGATVDELATDLGMTRLALYSVLRTLRRRELVGKERGRFVTTEGTGRAAVASVADD